MYFYSHEEYGWYKSVNIGLSTLAVEFKHNVLDILVATSDFEGCIYCPLKLL